MKNEKYLGEEKDFKKGLWTTSALTLIGLGLLSWYYDDVKLAILAGTIIFGVEYWSLKREYRSRH